ncbi:MAG TPA: amidohydrolase family protein [Chloroflexota bacterium]|nr:amidohydrolase family protein [Chloroflexota bacterium]
MSVLIDWHAHHTAPELVERFAALGARAPRPDVHDSPDFAARIAAMDAAGVDIQLVCQGAGLNADALPAEHALAAVRASNDLIADRAAPYADRLLPIASVTYADVEGSVAEMRRMAARGARAVMLYARPDLVGSPATERLFATAAELGWPVFLHGGGGTGIARDPALARLEDGGQGVAVSVLADAAVADFVVRTIAAGVFDRYPRLQIVIRSGGGSVALLLNKLWWKHRGPAGEQRYADVLRAHCLVDTANVDARTVQFLVDAMGEDRVVFGSDYCGGLGPLDRAVGVLDAQPDPARVRALTARNSRRLLGL